MKTMGLRRMAVLVWGALVLAGCDRGGAEGSSAGADSAAPKGRAAGAVAPPDSVFARDISTPDRALRTYWRIKGILDTLGVPMDSNAVPARTWTRADSTLATLYGGAALRAHQRDRTPGQRQRYAREILDVRQETESRATVTARVRNVTPIPPAATAGEYEMEKRTNGEVYRYIFERDAEGWKLVQVQTQQMDYMGDSTWSEYYQPEREMVPIWTYP
jgi:hypothetical protein